jgi:hypothetical protein
MKNTYYGIDIEGKGNHQGYANVKVSVLIVVVLIVVLFLKIEDFWTSA